MLTRRSLGLPIMLGSTMIVLLVVLAIGWVLLSVFGAHAAQGYSTLFWTLLPIGISLVVLVLVGVIIYLVLAIKSVNLNRRQSNFIDSVTHELKSPIASLKLYLQTLNRRQVDPRQQENFLRCMLDDVERLDQLINHLLDAARLDTKPVVDEREDVELATLLRQLGETVCLRYRIASDAISYDLAPCTLLATRNELEIVFRNLLDNAIKYSGAAPRVNISLAIANDQMAVVRITDNGRGIPIPMRRRIFSRFERLGLELEREKPGTGLGLYLVKTLVQKLRGTVRVESPDSGPGSVFEVRLPGAKPAESDLPPTMLHVPESVIPNFGSEIPSAPAASTTRSENSEVE